MKLYIEILFSILLLGSGIFFLVLKHRKKTEKLKRLYARLSNNKKEIVLAMQRAKLYKLVMILSGVFLFTVCVCVLVNEHIIAITW
ncbi:hypothetical protein G7074_04505 [Pedobacter sp. HDW13]|uniref:hypothetical protein n=1 Tax=unclassified Pedobacter TaxID=2628915 RepID=UPI000F5A5E62|nr:MULTISPECIES: hypothetical protein [unclassified Pedobacter]QIL38604.1 hypothetical protein G7074_04505 [Pedobacter sp. HDW13]RQO78745.1 hypothetical protein DBR40_05655 [Pedobacter sp. KBW01]